MELQYSKRLVKKMSISRPECKEKHGRKMKMAKNNQVARGNLISQSPPFDGA